MVVKIEENTALSVLYYITTFHGTESDQIAFNM